MRLSVHHATRFDFDQPSGHSIHDVRLTPRPAAGQRIVSWRIDGPGKRSEWLDGHGNQVTTFSVAQQHDHVEIVVHGLYEYSGSEQWLRYAEVPTLPAPFWLRNSGLTRHDASFDPLIEGLVEKAADARERVAVLHEVMKRVGERVAYKTGVSTVETTAVEALARGAGVAQDDAHVFIACCRRLGVPAAMSAAICATTTPSCMSGAPAIPGRRPGCPASNGWASIPPTTSARAATASGGDRARLSRRRPGQRPAGWLRRRQDERRGLGEAGGLITFIAKARRRRTLQRPREDTARTYEK